MNSGIDLSWWISVVEIPVFAGMFWIVRNNMSRLENSLKEQEEKSKHEMISMIENISAFRVDVAMNYASMSYLKDVENRLTAHLLRIEEKISTGGF
jgi:hypothetical protein